MNNQHPLGDDISKLSMDDLDKRYSEIMRRYVTARRMNMDQNIMRQLDIMLDGIEYEKMRRLDNAYSEPDDPVVIDTDPIDFDNIPRKF